MSRFLRMLPAGVALALTLGAGAYGAEPPAAPQAVWDKYKVLIERNMFLKERARATRRPATTTAARPSHPPEHYVMVTGITRQAEAYIAFLENTSDGRTTRVRAGSEIAGGRIADISMDAVTFEKDGRTTKVELGKSLDGGAAAASSGAAPASTPASGDEMSIIERMRLRRAGQIAPPKPPEPAPQTEVQDDTAPMNGAMEPAPMEQPANETR